MSNCVIRLLITGFYVNHVCNNTVVKSAKFPYLNKTANFKQYNFKMSNSDYKCVFNNITDNTMYKCKKATVFPNHTKHICNWEGILAEYIQHVKNKHKASYFCISNKSQKFEWKLPYMGDQTDLGIFQHNLGYFLYEIYFKEHSGEIHFSLACLNKLQENCKAFYKLRLHNENVSDMSFDRQVNVECDDILKPIHKQTHRIVINKNIVSKFLNQQRLFQWYITIIITCDVTSPTKTMLLD